MLRLNRALFRCDALSNVVLKINSSNDSEVHGRDGLWGAFEFSLYM